MSSQSGALEGPGEGDSSLVDVLGWAGAGNESARPAPLQPSDVSKAHPRLSLPVCAAGQALESKTGSGVVQQNASRHTRAHNTGETLVWLPVQIRDRRCFLHLAKNLFSVERFLFCLGPQR